MQDQTIFGFVTKPLSAEACFLFFFTSIYVGSVWFPIKSETDISLRYFPIRMCLRKDGTYSNGTTWKEFLCKRCRLKWTDVTLDIKIPLCIKAGESSFTSYGSHKIFLTCHGGLAILIFFHRDVSESTFCRVKKVFES